MEHHYALIPIDRIRPNPRNARTHSKKQVRQIAASILAFGFNSVVLIDERNELIAGHGRVEAAKQLGMTSVPAFVITGLSDAAKRALMLADNRIAQSAGWNREVLATELAALPEILAKDGIEISVTGFEPTEIDDNITDLEDQSRDPADDIDATCNGPAVTRPGDSWQLGQHRLHCGDARDPQAYTRLLADERAHTLITDPPYNVAIKSVVGRGARKHREFAMASGEMSGAEFIEFLKTVLGLAAQYSIMGAAHYAFMDWRHFTDLVTAGRQVYGAMLNTIVWVKTNAGQGSFYRSQHELIGVFRVGDAPHRNNVELGRHGRNRTNVWQYAGANTFRAGRLDDLRGHPTVKPVAMIADAIKDCTRRGDIVLDCFCGSGTTLLAAERVGRWGRGLEIDPIYVDLAVRRWQAFTGRDAVHAATGLTFEEMCAQRASGASDDAVAHRLRRQRRSASRTGR